MSCKADAWCENRPMPGSDTCWKHGPRCTVPKCDALVAPTERATTCREHGGGKACSVDGCVRVVLHIADHACAVHKKHICTSDGCQRKVSSMASRCRVHAQFTDCSSPAASCGERPQKCVQHGGGWSCASCHMITVVRRNIECSTCCGASNQALVGRQKAQYTFKLLRTEFAKTDWTTTRLNDKCTLIKSDIVWIETDERVQATIRKPALIDASARVVIRFEPDVSNITRTREQRAMALCDRVRVLQSMTHTTSSSPRIETLFCETSTPCTRTRKRKRAGGCFSVLAPKKTPQQKTNVKRAIMRHYKKQRRNVTNADPRQTFIAFR